MSDSRLNELPISMRERNWREILRFCIFTSLAIACLSFVGWLYVKVISPILIAAFFSYLIDPAIEILEKRNVNRSLASALVIFFGLGAITIFVVQVGPVIYEQLADLFHKAPTLLDAMIKGVVAQVRSLIQSAGFKETAGIEKALRSFSVVEQAFSRVQGAVDGIWTTGASILGTIVNMVLVPFITFFLLAEKVRIFRFLRMMVPRDIRPYFEKVFATLDETLQAVVRGHVKVAMALAFLYSIGFSAIGMTAGVAIGLAAGACRVIPYLDAFVGILLGVTYVFSQGYPPTKVFAVLGVVGVVQILDGALVTPNLIGAKVGLHPAIVILTIMAAAYHLGFWGVLIAIPAAASIKSLYKLALPVYRDSKWFRNDPA